MRFKQTFQTAGYVKPYPHTSSHDLVTQSANNWKFIDKLSSTWPDRLDCYDQFKTHLHTLMHNRPHQAEV